MIVRMHERARTGGQSARRSLSHEVRSQVLVALLRQDHIKSGREVLHAEAARLPQVREGVRE